MTNIINYPLYAIQFPSMECDTAYIKSNLKDEIVICGGVKVIGEIKFNVSNINTIVLLTTDSVVDIQCTRRTEGALEGKEPQDVIDIEINESE